MVQPPAPFASSVVKRSVSIAGHRTSVSLEDAFWDALKEMADARGMAVNALIAEIDAARTEDGGGLSSAIRVAVLGWYRGRGGGSGAGT